MIRGLHHTSRTVANLDRSLAFYRDLLGFVVVSDEELQGETLELVVGIPKVRLRVVELAAGEGPLLELIEYRQPLAAALSGAPALPDVGAHHVALLVDDIERAHAQLAAAGVRFTTAPQLIDAGIFAGSRTTYCFDPDGLPVELWQLPSAHQVPITTGGEKA